MNRIISSIKNNLWVLFTVYFCAWIGYGIFAMMTHIHWSVPFVAVGLVISANYLGMSDGEGLLALFAAMMGVYGLKVDFGLVWYAALALTLAPMLILMVLSTVIHHLARRKNVLID